jgi:hypothetical protein
VVQVLEVESFNQPALLRFQLQQHRVETLFQGRVGIRAIHAFREIIVESVEFPSIFPALAQTPLNASKYFTGKQFPIGTHKALSQPNNLANEGRCPLDFVHA